ncbi:MAG: sulfatase [Candidatus Eisenbacteria sp.]|nr:sulfatase [Candidatus Eisenbacteria bacterium]
MLQESSRREEASSWSHVGLASGSGLAAGALAGIVEHLALHAGFSIENFRELLYALAVFAAVGSVTGFVLGAILAAGRLIRRSWKTSGTLSAALAFHIAFFLLLVVAYRLNVRTGMTPLGLSARLVLNGACAAGAVGVGVVLHRLLLGARQGILARVAQRLHPVTPVLSAVPILVIVALGGFAAIQAIGGHPAARAPAGISRAGRPNVVLIVINALRKDHVSGYGYERRTTLALDHLMDDSISFENAFAASGGTVPSVVSILTGVGPAVHRAAQWGAPLPAELTTLAESMAAAGYVCGAFLGNRVMDSVTSHDRGFHDRYPPRKPFWCFRMQTTVEGIAAHVLRRTPLQVDRLFSEAERWMDRNRGCPFFAFIHLSEPSPPYEPPPPYDRLFDPEYDGLHLRTPPIELARSTGGFLDWDPLEPAAAALPAPVRRNMIALYDGEIAYVDSRIDVFLKGLQERGTYDRTLIVVTADHGEEFFEHHGWFHGQSLFDELVRVPLVVKLPGQARAGTRREDPAAGADIMPSILSVAGLANPQSVGGIDLFGTVSAHPEDRPVFSERPPFLYSVREGRWKLIHKKTPWTNYVRLFDVDADPQELTNVANEYPEVRDRLVRMLQPRMATAPASGTSMPSGELNDFQQERLKELGYVQ